MREDGNVLNGLSMSKEERKLLDKYRLWLILHPEQFWPYCDICTKHNNGLCCLPRYILDNDNTKIIVRRAPEDGSGICIKWIKYV